MTLPGVARLSPKSTRCAPLSLRDRRAAASTARPATAPRPQSRQRADAPWPLLPEAEAQSRRCCRSQRGMQKRDKRRPTNLEVLICTNDAVGGPTLPVATGRRRLARSRLLNTYRSTPTTTQPQTEDIHASTVRHRGAHLDDRRDRRSPGLFEKPPGNRPRAAAEEAPAVLAFISTPLSSSVLAWSCLSSSETS